MTTAALYQWPAQARFGRTVPKARFYERGTVRAGLRTKFVDEIQQISWAFKLAESTIRLSKSSEVPEIQVFEIETKGTDVDDNVLLAIDRAIPFPIMFEVHVGSTTRMAAALKQLTGSTPKVGAYLTTEWIADDAQRVPLPPAVTLAGLYDSLMTPLLPFARRRGESVTDATTRMDSARKIEREVASFTRRLHRERQLNRKIELRRQITERTGALSALTDAPLEGR